jgi:hypothetical protein
MKFISLQYQKQTSLLAEKKEIQKTDKYKKNVDKALQTEKNKAYYPIFLRNLSFIRLIFVDKSSCQISGCFLSFSFLYLLPETSAIKKI